MHNYALRYMTNYMKLLYQKNYTPWIALCNIRIKETELKTVLTTCLCKDLILFYRLTFYNHFSNIGENKFSVLIKHFKCEFDKTVLLVSFCEVRYRAGA